MITTDTTTTAGASQAETNAVVRLDNLHVAWDTDLILHGISLSIPAGQTVAITGSNGSGKSTTLKAILGTAPITSGDALLFGRSITARGRVPWKKIGYVPQRISSGGAISASAIEVVRSGLLGPTRLWALPGDTARAMEALERVGMAHRAHSPMNILSGGQAQRVLIARALVRRPELLIMDEPMGSTPPPARAWRQSSPTRRQRARRSSSSYTSWANSALSSTASCTSAPGTSPTTALPILRMTTNSTTEEATTALPLRPLLPHRATKASSAESGRERRMIDAVTTLLSSQMMQRSLLAALIVGLTAPIIGTYLVHRRLAMLGDGIGHISLTGVALGWLVGTFANVSPADSWAVPGAVIISLLGAIMIELVRQSGRTSGDTALAMLFYGGIAGGVLLIGLAGGTSAQLNSYLFGSISTVRWSDISLITILGLAIIMLGVGLAPALFSVTNDEDFARSTGLPVRTLSLLIAILSALTVAVAMRVVGSLLVSALMVIPVAIAQLGARSFRSTMGIAMVLGVLICTCGLSLTYFIDLSPGATIVVGAIGLYAVGFMIRAVVDRIRRVRRLRVARTHNQHPEQAVTH